MKERRRGGRDRRKHRREEAKDKGQDLLLMEAREGEVEMIE
jgi:hypothetical protein